MKKEVAILVISCDKYADLWDNYFYLLDKYWPDCNYNIYLQSNFKNYNENDKVQTLKIGNDDSWSDGLIKSLDRLSNYEYVLLFLEDLYLSKSVDPKLLNETIEHFIDIDGNYLTLVSEPKPNKYFDEYFGAIKKGSMYRVTTTASIWRIDVLKNLLLDNESAWQFEKNGSIRSDKFDKFFSVYANVFEYVNTVVKGNYTRKAVEFIKKEDLKMESKRPINTFFQELKFDSYKFLRNLIFKIVPTKYHRILLRN